MPTTRRSRTLTADREDVWAIVADPYHLPRWWPRVTRVEGADENAFTEVLTTDKGRSVRADFRVLDSSPPERRTWGQEVEGTPFARVLRSAETTVTLTPADAGTRVTIEVRQRLRGVARLGGIMVRRATRAQLDGALEGLETACAR
jgi:uncharacterized protein YndB with AHSA1/START domain